MKKYDFPEVDLYGLTLCEMDRICDLMCEKDRIESEMDSLSDQVISTGELLYEDYVSLSRKKELYEEELSTKELFNDLSIDMEKVTREIDRFFLMMEKEGKTQETGKK